MKRIHIIKTDLQRSDLTDLLDAIASLGLKAGWLDWRPQAEPEDSSVGGALVEMASAPVLRAVAVESRRVTSIKPMAGEAVFRDVLRLHFRGCAVILVRALSEPLPPELVSAPEIRVEGSSYRVTAIDEEGGARRFLWTAEELAARLRRPRPFTDGA